MNELLIRNESESQGGSLTDGAEDLLKGRNESESQGGSLTDGAENLLKGSCTHLLTFDPCRVSKLSL